MTIEQLTCNPTGQYVKANLKPLVLLADSQLLFFKEDDKPFLSRLTELFGNNQPMTAAYIGASNGDDPRYYEIFTHAMAAINITNCRHITCELTPSQRNFVNQAQIILLAGGNIHLGWQTMQKLSSQLKTARQNGAIIIGTSAGAVQMGQLGWHDKAQLYSTDLFSTLGYIPAVFGAHEERQNWHQLSQVINLTAGLIPGIGIQAGAGIMVSPCNKIQAIRKPMIHLSFEEEQLKRQSIWQLQLGCKG